MVQRSVALCDGKYIGIETIYTVINGKQINKPDKLKELRELGRSGKLLCACGCGAELIVVAGDRNIRNQHFRLKNADEERTCHYRNESDISVNSKIVLHCWLESMLGDGIETRVPICNIFDTERRYEYSFLSLKNHLAISYCNARVNLLDEKIDLLTNNNDIKLIYIIDKANWGNNGQYPEFLMKIQNRQGYILFLSVTDKDYSSAILCAGFYKENIDGIWEEEVFLQDELSKYSFDENGNLTYNGRSVNDSLYDSMRSFDERMKHLQDKRDEEIKQKEILAEQRRLAEEKRKKEQEEKNAEEAAEKERIEAIRIKKEKEEAAEEERQWNEFIDSLPVLLSQQESLVKDKNGDRWIKCSYCGKISTVTDFSSYGGLGSINLGQCYECTKNPNIKKTILIESKSKSKEKKQKSCPRCGGELIEKNGRYGPFIGCKNYPNCEYTTAIYNR